MRTIKSLAFVLIAAALPLLAQTNWQLVRTMHIGGTGGWDYVTVDRQNHHLYVTRSTHTMVIDSESGKVLADIPGQKRSHGVAIVPEAGRGFISDGGGEGAIVIFDLKTNAVLGTIAAQPDADGIIYDRSIGRVLCVSGDGGVLMSLDPNVDPKTGKLEATIELGGKPEFFASDRKGNVYVNLEDKDQVAVVDMKARKVLTHWPVAPGGAPVGMAMNTRNRQLFIGCRKPAKMIVMDADSGKVLADLPIGAGVDATALDKGEAFASSGDGTLTVVKQTAPGKFEVAETVKTARGARTMGVDRTTDTIYLPTAEFEPSEAGKRPAAKPDSFMILVVGKK